MKFAATRDRVAEMQRLRAFLDLDDHDVGRELNNKAKAVRRFNVGEGVNHRDTEAQRSKQE